MTAQDTPLVSIIIPCRPNRPELITACLQSLVDNTADRSRLEVLVKADIGDAETLRAANTFSDKLPVRVILMDGSHGFRGLAGYTNELARQAVGKLVWWWSDEVRMLTHGWDLILADYEAEADGFNLLLAQLEKGTSSCYPILPKRWLDATGRWIWLGHTQIDWWIWAVRKLLSGISQHIIIRDIRIKDTTISGETAVDRGPSFAVLFEGPDIERELRVDAIKIRRLIQPMDRAYVVEAAKITSNIQDHLLTLYDLAVEVNAQVAVELGAGWSTYAITAAVNATEGQLYSIDIAGGGQPKGPRHHPIRGDDLEVVKTWEQPIDFLFIDTLHTYPQTKAELETWLPFVRKGGIIAMHDTDGPLGAFPGCRIALDEFLAKHRGEYSAVHYPHCNGLSVLRKLKLGTG